MHLINMCSKGAQGPWPPGELNVLLPHNAQSTQLQARAWVLGEFSRVASGENGTGAWRTSPFFQVCFWGKKKGALENVVNNGLLLCEGLVSFHTKSVQQKLSSLEDCAGLVMVWFFIQENSVHALRITLKLCKHQQAVYLSLGIFNK